MNRSEARCLVRYDVDLNIDEQGILNRKPVESLRREVSRCKEVLSGCWKYTEGKSELDDNRGVFCLYWDTKN